VSRAEQRGQLLIADERRCEKILCHEEHRDSRRFELLSDLREPVGPRTYLGIVPNPYQFFIFKWLEEQLELL
jgi:hypothetical protein